MPVILPATGWGIGLHLKSRGDDMTNQGSAVNMHAVRYAAPAAAYLCLSSSIG
jgi:hypothetical protein